ncbi:MAG: glutamine--fructose-6-phosphate transaminase (isomerizing) [Candidatus Omnitrophota bacterium]
MCGIIGYVGTRSAVPILLEGLQKLEYRGYDSSGLGIIDLKKNRIVIRKRQGKINQLRDLIKRKALPNSSIGISHTRWATHGAPNRINAHPHFDHSKTFLVVHNGIIENYQQLKTNLEEAGVKFVSQTDTEVISHLIGFYYSQITSDGNNGLTNEAGGEIVSSLFEEAVRRAVADLEGSFAVGILCNDCPDSLIAARVGSPLIIGIGEGENFIASDVPAILDRTKKIIYLKDKEIAFLTKDKVKLSTFTGEDVSPKIETVKFSVDAVQKQGYAHFMLKEIHEQPDVLRRMFKERLKGGEVVLEGMELTLPQTINHIVIVACGTAYHAGLLGKYLIEGMARVPVTVDAASEFRYREPILTKNTMVIAISQSGETADTLAAVREAHAQGAKVVSVCNVVGSSLARESDGILYTHAGPEIGVASTKAYVAQIAMLYLLALKIGRENGQLKQAVYQDLIAALEKIPDAYEQILVKKSHIQKIARKNSHFGCFLYLGRNVNYPSALEGALKLKEISYIPAEGYAAGEMKHGPIALIDEYRAVVCITPQSDTYDKMISNMQEIRARRGKMIAIATEGDEVVQRHANHVIYIPKTKNILTPLLVALPFQLLAYYIAVALNCDVDQPRNLAKSVTVE